MAAAGKRWWYCCLTVRRIWPGLTREERNRIQSGISKRKKQHRHFIIGHTVRSTINPLAAAIIHAVGDLPDTVAEIRVEQVIQNGNRIGYLAYNDTIVARKTPVAVDQEEQRQALKKRLF